MGCLVIGLASCGARGGQTGDEVVHSGSSALDGSKVVVQAAADAALIVGEAGATTPGATVEVVNTRSGAQVSVIADDDGAFEVSIAADAGDEIEVRVGDAHLTREAAVVSGVVNPCPGESGCPEISDADSETSADDSPDAASGTGGGATCGGLAERQAQAPFAGQCSAQLHLLTCSRGDGSSSICLSDVTNACPELDESFDSCESRCEDGEYAMACGGVNPMNEYEQPPEVCRSAGATPGGVVYYCCPCEI